MEIFDSVVAVFNFIYSVLQTIIDAIANIPSLFNNIITTILSITKILPNELYYTFNVFIILYSTIFVYKLVRKG